MMRSIFCSFMLLAATGGRSEPNVIMFAPESLSNDCTRSWQMTESEGKTTISFQDLELALPSQATAEVKHCRIAWKPLIPAGCYAPSARLEIAGQLWVNARPAAAVRAQLRMAHDLLGQGDNSPVVSQELAEGPFKASMELPAERFQQAWDEVKLITHLSLLLRHKNLENGSFSNETSAIKARVRIDSLKLEALRSRDCSTAQPQSRKTKEVP